MMQKQYFVIKNSIFNFDLSPMDITVYSAIVSMINGKTKSITAKYSAIAKRANVSQLSVIRSVKILREKGLIRKYIRKNYDGHYISCRYKVVDLCSQCYTLLPMNIWDYNLSPSAFLIYLYLGSRCDEFGECFPSLRQVREGIDLSLSTISKGVDELQDKTLVDKNFYITKNSDFGHNRYNVLCKVQLKNKNPRSNDYKTAIVKAGSKNFKVVSFYTNRLKTEFEFCMLKQIA